MGDAYWKYQQLSAAASEGARKAIVSRSLSDADREAAIETAVQNAAPSLDAADLTITINSTWDAGDDVTVSATYPIVIDIFKIPVWSGNLSSERTMRVEQ